jgi:hypothetical protein
MEVSGQLHTAATMSLGKLSLVPIVYGVKDLQLPSSGSALKMEALCSSKTLVTHLPDYMVSKLTSGFCREAFLLAQIVFFWHVMSCGLVEQY